jgi:Zn-dependent protease
VCAVPAPTGQPRSGPQITPIQWVGLAVLILLFLWQMGILRFDTPGGVAGYLQQALPGLIALVLAITVHEFSHGLVATWFGDPTPRQAGRLTLNPIRHLDPIGTLMILIGPIGWGRPMPINPSRMRDSNLGWALSSLAGPVSNVVAAAAVYVAVAYLDLGLGRSAVPYIDQFVRINVLLAVFNLLPVPPLDGFGFIFGLSPTPVKLALLPLQNLGPLILLAILFLPATQGLLNGFLRGGATMIYNFLGVLASGA